MAKINLFNYMRILLLCIMLTPILNYYFLLPFDFWFLGVIFNYLVFFSHSRLLRREYFWFQLACCLIILLFFYNILTSNVTDVIKKFVLQFGSLLTFINVSTFYRSSIKQINPRRLEKFFQNILLFVAIFGFVQWVSYNFYEIGLSEIYRSRTDAYGINKQISSIFEEPAFLGLFLSGYLYSYLFFRERVFKLPLMLILVLVLFSFSLVAFGLTVAILSMWIVAKKSQFTARVFVVLCSLYVTYATASYFYQRVNNEVLEFIGLLGSDPRLIRISSSGGQRTIQELNWLFFTVKQSPLFGLGITYGDFGELRTAALNTLTEIMVRYGVIGVFVFTLYIVEFFRDAKIGTRLFLCVYILLYCFSDGSIARLEYWFPLCVIYIFRMNYANYRHEK